MAYLLREVAANGSVTDHALDSMSNIQVTEGSTYSLIDSETMQPVEAASLRRRGDDLELQVEGELVADVQGFYTEGAMASFSDGESVVSSTADQGEAGNAWQAAEIGGVHAGYYALGLGAIALATGGGSGAAAAVQTVLIAAAAGPFVTTMGVEIYGEDGTLLAELEHDFSTGPVPVDIDGDYTGALLVKVIDINGDAGDYLDEATGEIVSLGSQTIRAMATTENTEVSVTPLTELATVLAGVTEDNTITEEQVTTNDQVEELFGITDILGDVTTIVDDDFDDSDGTSDAEAYGQILAILSGADQVLAEEDETPETPITLTETIQQLADAITEASQDSETLELGAEAATLIVEGANALNEGIQEQAAAAEEAGEEFDVPVVDVEESLPEEIVEESEVVVVDVIPPDVTILAADDSGDLASGDQTDDTTVILSGTTEAGATVEVFDGETSLGEATVEGTSWSFEAALVGGNSYNFNAVATDGVGNSSAPTADFIVSVAAPADTTPPTTTISGIDISADTGTSDSDFLTSTAAQTITATLSAALEAGEVVMLSVDGGATFTDITDSVDGTAISVQATLTSGSIQLRVDDASGNQGEVASQAYTLDTTAPTTTVGDIAISDDTGTSASDGITNTASQTITAVLSAALAEGEALYGSLDAGVTVVDITEFVTGTELSWPVTITSFTAINLYVKDAAGNSGTPSGRTLTLDTTAPTVTAVVNEAGQIVVTFNEAFDGLALEDFTLTVNDAPATLTGFSQDGDLVTLTLEDQIYSSDIVNSLAIAAADVAGNAVATVTGLANGSIGQKIELNKSVAELVASSNFAIEQTGGAGSDLLAVNVTETVLGSTTGFTGTSGDVSIVQNGAAGDDTISAKIDINIATADSGTVTAAVSYVSLEQDGGDGADSLSIDLDAQAYAGSTDSATANIANNTIAAFGGADVDEVDLNLYAQAQSADGTVIEDALAAIMANDIAVSGEDIDLVANAFAGANASSASATAVIASNNIEINVDSNAQVSLLATAAAESGHSVTASIFQNDIEIDGSDDADTIAVNIHAQATNIQGYTAEAYAYSNDISIYGFGGNDNLTVDIKANASATSNATASILASYLTGPSFPASGPSIVVMGGEGTDTLNVLLQANALGDEDVNASVGLFDLMASGEAIDIDLIAGAGVATIDAEGSAPSAAVASALVAGNDIEVNVDSEAEIDLLAHAIATSRAYATVTGNVVDLIGGSGADHIELALSARATGSSSAIAQLGSDLFSSFGPPPGFFPEIENSISVMGGEGVDAISVQLSAQADGETYARAGIGGFEIEASGETVDIALVASATAVSSSYASAAASSNVIEVNIGSEAVSDTASDFVHIFASASATSSSAGAKAYVRDNTIDMLGNSGDNHLVAAIGASATATSGPADAAASYNLIYLDGGAGSDTLSANLSAFASTDATLADNGLLLLGGAGADTINVNMYAGYLESNVVLARGGEGADNINFNVNASSSAIGNLYSVYFGDTDHLGDVISGAGFSAGDDFVLNFYGGTFGTSGPFNGSNDSEDGRIWSSQFAVATAAVSESNYFFYDSSENALYYDADGNNAGAAVLAAQFSESFAGLTADNIAIAGQQTVSGTASSFYESPIFQFGGSQDDNLNANVYGATSSRVYVSFMDVVQFGFGGDDVLNVQFTAATDSSHDNAIVYNNAIEQDGGSGSDNFGLYLAAGLSSSSSASSSQAYVSYNDILILGGSGDDAAGATGTSADDFQLYALATYDSGANAFVDNNYIEIDGEDGSDEFGLYLVAEASAVNGAASAQVRSNTVNIYGGEGVDELTLAIEASADGASFSPARILENRVNLNGDEGNDNLLIELAALGTYGNIGGSSSSSGNEINLSGGAGVDTLVLDIEAYRVLHNDFNFDGGAGADTFSLNASIATRSGASGYVSQNEFVFNYGGIGDFGDSIIGFAEVFSSNSVAFNFSGSDFNFSESGFTGGSSQFGSGSTLADMTSNQYFFYLTNTATSSFALYYDADGGGVGDAAALVANFDAAVDIGSGDIQFGGTGFTTF